jgi:hypothetical protein
MGTSVKMIEQYYGHVTPAHVANQLAGRRMGKHKPTNTQSLITSNSQKAEVKNGAPNK